MLTYDKDKLFTIPAAFTALNGAAQTFKLTVSDGVSIVAPTPVDPKNPTEEELKAIAIAQGNVLRILEVLRSAGAQPIITEIADKTVTFTVEQAHVYGEAGDVQVSSKKLADEAKSRIKKLFANVQSLEGITLLPDNDDAVIIGSAIGALVG